MPSNGAIWYEMIDDVMTGKVFHAIAGYDVIEKKLPLKCALLLLTLTTLCCESSGQHQTTYKWPSGLT
jgi:hypothetical protein